MLVGENNAGKSNVIDGLRTVLEAEGGPRAACWLRPDDFAHDGHGTRITDELELEVRLAELTEIEQARMVTCLAPSLGAGFARIRLQAKLGADGRVLAQHIGGDASHADAERHAREAVRFTYLHPLRDAAADLRPGRENRLVELLGTLAPDGHPDREAIVGVIEDANTALDGIDAVTAAKAQIAGRLGKMTGSHHFRQESDLAFADPEFKRAVGALRAKIGRLAPLEMAEGGLGFNNLLYMAVLLAALADRARGRQPPGSARRGARGSPAPPASGPAHAIPGRGGGRRDAGHRDLALAELLLRGASSSASPSLRAARTTPARPWLVGPATSG